jgi:hypothetical protein
MSININDKAYCKTMLHIIKHNLENCFGLLIGKKINDNEYTVNDVIPLSHDNILAPQIEFCFQMVRIKIIY